MALRPWRPLRSIESAADPDAYAGNGNEHAIVDAAFPSAGGGPLHFPEHQLSEDREAVDPPALDAAADIPAPALRFLRVGLRPAGHRLCDAADNHGRGIERLVRRGHRLVMSQP